MRRGSLEQKEGIRLVEPPRGVAEKHLGGGGRRIAAGLKGWVELVAYILTAEQL